MGKTQQGGDGRSIFNDDNQPKEKPARTALAKEELNKFIARIERLQDEKDAIGADIKEVFAEAKAAGFDTKTIRRVISARKLDRAEFQEQQALFELYGEAAGIFG